MSREWTMQKDGVGAFETIFSIVVSNWMDTRKAAKRTSPSFLTPCLDMRLSKVAQPQTSYHSKQSRKEVSHQGRTLATQRNVWRVLSPR
jgi:hypothetical protein